MQTTSWALAIALLVCPIAAADQRPVLALVIDDLGYSYDRGEQAITLPGDHTFAIIPGTLNSQKLAAFARQQDKEIILHLPLQALSENVDAEPNVLTEKMDEDELRTNVVAMLKEFPHIKGINNHMGSLLTEVDYVMRPIMDSIKSFNPNLYFLDSRTTPRSQAYVEAINSGLNSLRRDVFLDNDHEDIESIRMQYEYWLEKARKNGYAVAIGHPHTNTIDFLRENLPQAQAEFQFLSVSKLIENLDAEREPWLDARGVQTAAKP